MRITSKNQIISLLHLLDVVQLSSEVNKSDIDHNPTIHQMQLRYLEKGTCICFVDIRVPD